MLSLCVCECVWVGGSGGQRESEHGVSASACIVVCVPSTCLLSSRRSRSPGRCASHLAHPCPSCTRIGYKISATTLVYRIRSTRSHGPFNPTRPRLAAAPPLSNTSARSTQHLNSEPFPDLSGNPRLEPNVAPSSPRKLTGRSMSTTPAPRTIRYPFTPLPARLSQRRSRYLLRRGCAPRPLDKARPLRPFTNTRTHTNGAPTADASLLPRLPPRAPLPQSAHRRTVRVSKVEQEPAGPHANAHLRPRK